MSRPISLSSSLTKPGQHHDPGRLRPVGTVQLDFLESGHVLRLVNLVGFITKRHAYLFQTMLVEAQEMGMHLGGLSVYLHSEHLGI